MLSRHQALFRTLHAAYVLYILDLKKLLLLHYCLLQDLRKGPKHYQDHQAQAPVCLFVY